MTRHGCVRKTTRLHAQLVLQYRTTYPPHSSQQTTMPLEHSTDTSLVICDIAGWTRHQFMLRRDNITAAQAIIVGNLVAASLEARFPGPGKIFQAFHIERRGGPFMWFVR